MHRETNPTPEQQSSQEDLEDLQRVIGRAGIDRGFDMKASIDKAALRNDSEMSIMEHVEKVGIEIRTPNT